MLLLIMSNLGFFFLNVLSLNSSESDETDVRILVPSFFMRAVDDETVCWCPAIIKPSIHLRLIICRLILTNQTCKSGLSANKY